MVVSASRGSALGRSPGTPDWGVYGYDYFTHFTEIGDFGNRVHRAVMNESANEGHYGDNPPDVDFMGEME